ncbi:unnamed protein product [Dicrocoelium dendriticum]|nr:unnamed protein product [Dicrocoelium dendriticum]
MDCSSSPVRAQETAPWYPLQVTMNETKFPVDYHKLPTFAKEWQINRLLNAEAETCQTTVKLLSNYSQTTFTEDERTSLGYILTGPADTNVCRKIRKIKRFVDGKFNPTKCTKMGEDVEPGPKLKRIVQYRLVVHQKISTTFGPQENSLMFVIELNDDECRYNGYWRHH